MSPIIAAKSNVTAANWVLIFIVNMFKSGRMFYRIYTRRYWRSEVASLDRRTTGIVDNSRQGHYCDVIMNTIASQITSLTIVYLTVNSGTDHRKHQSSASLAFVRGIHRRPVNSPHKGPVTRKMFPFDDVIMGTSWSNRGSSTRNSFPFEHHIGLLSGDIHGVKLKMSL